MRIAIPVARGSLDPHFGHCQFFALVDGDAENKKITSSTTVDAPPHEPGLLPAWLAGQGADVLLAGGMGSRANAYLAGEIGEGANACDH